MWRPSRNRSAAASTSANGSGRAGSAAAVMRAESSDVAGPGPGWTAPAGSAGEGSARAGAEGRGTHRGLADVMARLAPGAFGNVGPVRRTRVDLVAALALRLGLVHRDVGVAHQVVD